MSSTTDSVSVTDLIKQYKSLLDRVTKDSKGPTVGDRKQLQLLYSKYSQVSNDDKTLLSDMSILQDLLQKCQQIIR